MKTTLPSLTLPPVRRARHSDLRPLSELLAHAYVADPVSRWLIPGDEQWTRQARPYFSFLLRSAFAEGELFANEDCSATALWRRPNSSVPGRLGKALHGLRMLSLLRARSSRGVRLARLLEEAHPNEPHWFLQFVAVEVLRRGTGLAGSILRPVLDRCDREGQVAYLELSDPAHTPIFQHFGFEVRSKIDLSPGPVILCMRRAPRRHSLL